METEHKYYLNRTKEQLKSIYPNITNEDLDFREGKEKELMESLGFKLGKTREELVTIISGLEKA